jgi:drug/metabolite transporter (DMT)-like permease
MWVLLSLLCAFTLASGDALTKKALRGAGEYLIGWLRLLFAVPLLLFVLIFVESPPLDSTFYKAFALALPFEILAFVLYIKALKISPLSLTMPFLAFTPVFLIGISYFIVGEKPSLMGICGILLVGAGGYILNFHHLDKGVLEPLRAVLREKGSLMMLAVAVIYSVTSSLGKVCINHSSALFFGPVYFTVLAVAYTPFALREIKGFNISGKVLGIMAAAGFLNAAMIITHVAAMSLANVAYMIAIKRTSLLFSVLYGWLLFKEGRMKERSAGAVLMFAGFVLVVTAS